MYVMPGTLTSCLQYGDRLTIVHDSSLVPSRLSSRSRCRERLNKAPCPVQKATALMLPILELTFSKQLCSSAFGFMYKTEVPLPQKGHFLLARGLAGHGRGRSGAASANAGFALALPFLCSRQANPGKGLSVSRVVGGIITSHEL
jgi:hypothetical protein